MNAEAIQQTMARNRIYRLLAAAFLYPDEALVAGLREGWAETAESPPTLPDGEGVSLSKALTSAATAGLSLDALQAQYRQTFGHTISQECPPYETQYGSAHLFQQAQKLGDIAGFYRAFGVEVSDRAKERLDHIAVELEFMAFLTLKEAYAFTHHGEEQASICREGEQRFLEEHLGRWAPIFARLLARRAQQGFYREMATFLEAFIHTECGRLQARPSLFDEGDLLGIAYEPEGACFQCGGKDLCFDEPKEGA